MPPPVAMPEAMSETSPVAHNSALDFAPGSHVAVQLPLPLDAYDYRVPVDCFLRAGDIVEVPLGRRFEMGVVWGPGKGDVPPGKIKDVVHRLELPPLGDSLRSFI